MKKKKRKNRVNRNRKKKQCTADPIDILSTHTQSARKEKRGTVDCDDSHQSGKKIEKGERKKVDRCCAKTRKRI